MYLIQSTWSVVIKEEKRNRGDCDAPKVTIKELVFSNIYIYNTYNSTVNLPIFKLLFFLSFWNQL